MAPLPIGTEQSGWFWQLDINIGVHLWIIHAVNATTPAYKNRTKSSTSSHNPYSHLPSRPLSSQSPMTQCHEHFMCGGPWRLFPSLVLTRIAPNI
jgi:hypothetical protein